MAVIVGCKCDCPIVGYVKWRAIKSHKDECHHRTHESLQPVTFAS